MQEMCKTSHAIKEQFLRCLMGISTVLYSMAVVSHSWFTLEPVSFYGVWYVKFCDYLRCQIIPAMFAEEPGWYHIVQLLSIVAWLGISSAFIMMIVPSWLPKKCLQDETVISRMCIVSGMAIFTSLALFYYMLCESSDTAPQVSWSSLLAAVAGLGDFLVGILLMC